MLRRHHLPAGPDGLAGQGAWAYIWWDISLGPLKKVLLQKYSNAQKSEFNGIC